MMRRSARLNDIEERRAAAHADVSTSRSQTEIGLSEVTVKVHRGQAMRKMRADTAADVIRMADLLGTSEGMVNVKGGDYPAGSRSR
ncbi:LuxR C-terminal-related transcriptional regulator [Rhizobium sp. AN95]|uniref:LuxR C-terminal-related transcriptional regulator n=1 Tax=Rhizobium sp. AN95 TaxID=3035216 RepID=UPI002B26392B|nr:LuxR C-terminal-related transcriptional regulator [Rhizobium sp. AN95]